MVTFAIGDVQGCAVTLRRLLDRLRREAGFDPARDELWLTGDLVNRGPRSLEVLRWAVESAAGRGAEPLGERLHVVLGNHDLHLIGVVAGAEREKEKDTLDEVLAAPDLDQLIEWLRRQPLLHTDFVDGRPHVLVHAGLPPEWSVEKASKLAREVSDALAGPKWRKAAEAIKSPSAESWSDSLSGEERISTIAATLTRLRIVDGRGRMLWKFKGPPGEAPRGTVPWFAAPGRASTDHVVVCGHWAALGLLIEDDVVACDSGCVWGAELTAVRLAGKKKERAVVQERNADGKD